jgi:hypothetical protein
MVQRAICTGLVILSCAAAGAQPEPVSQLAVLPVQLDVVPATPGPKLFSDRLFAAARAFGGSFEVVDARSDADVGALSAEQRRALMGCDTPACVAGITEGLEFDRLLLTQISWKEGEWTLAGVLINTHPARVESRSLQFVVGDVRATLPAVSSMVNQLFLSAGLVAGKLEPNANSAEPNRSRRVAGFLGPRPFTPNAGHAERRGGAAMVAFGLVLAGSGMVAAAVDEHTAPSWQDEHVDSLVARMPIYGLGLLLAGLGSGSYLDGWARSKTGDPWARGHSSWSALGWTAFAVSLVGPLYFAVEEQKYATWAAGVGAGALSAGAFLLRMSGSACWVQSSDEREHPVVSLVPMALGSRNSVLGLALAFDY